MRTIFSKEIFSKRNFPMKKKQERDDKNKFFLKKLERRIFFQTRKDYQKLRCGKIFWLQKQFLRRIFYEVQKIQISLWKRNFKKKQKNEKR